MLTQSLKPNAITSVQVTRLRSVEAITQYPSIKIRLSQSWITRSPQTIAMLVVILREVMRTMFAHWRGRKHRSLQLL